MDIFNCTYAQCDVYVRGNRKKEPRLRLLVTDLNLAFPSI